MIKKAFILGAGLGTRLRPLTFIRPKPLIPILGKPLIEYSINHLKTIGVNHIIINTHHLPEEYLRIIGSGKRFNIKISYSYEPKLLDTGGGLKNIEPFINNETFIMYNGDIITNVDLKKMINFHKKNKCLATLLVSKRHSPLHVKMDKDNKILDLGSHLKNSKKKSLYAFCGIHILEPEIFRYIPPKKPISIITIYQKLIKNGFTIMGYPLGKASWREIGNISSYNKLSKNKTPIIKKKKLTPDGSLRKFTRIKTNFGSIISMHYNLSKKENRFYADILLFLKRLGVNVPDLIYNDSNRLILEDLGDKDLFLTCKKDIDINLYKKSLEQIIKLHKKGKKLYEKNPFPISQPFNYKLYRWESSYFEKNCLKGYFKLRLDKKTKSKLHKDFHFLARRLSKEPLCLIHRDFQSKNIMIKDNKPYLIDFQGLRFGLPHYDLASILYDPYAKLSQKTRKKLLSYYKKNIPVRRNFMEIYKLAAIQRLMQALGAYGYLGLKLGKKEFLSYIPQAVNNLRLVLEEVDGLEGLKEILEKPII